MSHSFEKYCKDYKNIENYEKAKKDNFKGWHCHHRLETHNSDGERRLVDITKKELIAINMYYHRQADELIFLTSMEHRKLHKFSEETIKKLSEAKKGKKFSEKHKMNISEAKKGHTVSEETRNKLSRINKGKHLSEETRKKISGAKKGNTYAKGMHWFNNGKENKYCYECPEGFVPGMLR